MSHDDPSLHGVGEYLIEFAFRHQDFLFAELDALLDMFGLTPSAVYDKSLFNPKVSPFVRVNLPNDEAAAKVASRAVLVKTIYHVWGAAARLEEVVEQVSNLEDAVKRPYLDSTDTWRVLVNGFGKKIPADLQDQKRELFAPILPFKGKVELNKNKVVNKFWLIEDYGRDAKPETAPKRVFFAREIAKGRRDLVNKYDLKQRTYIGPTSMDNELSFVMANMIQARPGSIVIDPFVGTGSLLVPSTVFGAQCMGSDIDIRILKGKAGKTIFSNFDQYKLPHPDLIRMDFSPHGRCTNDLPGGYIHGIICDPPYGIRAGARKIGSKRAVVKQVQKHHLHDHIPQTQRYEAQDVMNDLLDSSARILVMGGRLTYLLPVVIEEYSDDQLPKHPCLEVIANSEQQLTLKLSRRLITMKKVREYDDQLVADFKAQMNVSQGGDAPYDNLKEKLKKKIKLDDGVGSSNAS